MTRIFKTAFKLFFVMTVLTGVIYPLAITGIVQLMFSEQAGGSLVFSKGVLRGSRLIAQKFEDPKYFWPRPSGVEYNSLSSGGTNLGLTSSQLVETVKKRKDKFQDVGAPEDLLFASGSGLDPHISPRAALYQIGRVAEARKFNDEQKQRLISLVKAHIEERQWGYLGEPRVNVFELNLDVDQM